MRWLARVAVAVVVAVGVVAGFGACSNDRPSPPMVDAEPAACGCAAGQVCIARFDGTCRMSTECVAPMAACASNACSPACEAAYCQRPYQCQNRPPCGSEPKGAFTCYGP